MTRTIPLTSLPLASDDGEPVLESDEPWLWYNAQGVDLTLLRAMLDLAPIDRLRRMERHARDIQTLMAHGERHRAAKAP